MTQIELRPFAPTDADYQGIVNVTNNVYVDEATSVENMKHRDKHNANRIFERFVHERNGRIVAYGGYGEAWWSVKEGKYFIFTLVEPEYHNQGIGTAFYDHINGLVTQRDDLRALDAYTREDFPQAVRFLEKRGFKQAMRFPRSKINPQTFEPEKYNGLLTKLKAEGVEFLTLRQLTERYDNPWFMIYESENEIDKDIPSPEPFKVMPFEEFLERRKDHPNLLEDAFYVALDNDQVVGISALWNKPKENEWNTGLTGVLRSHRRRGLATALKALALGYAKSQGIVEIATDNEENNPMYQLNLQLGFKPAPADLDFMKHFDE